MSLVLDRVREKYPVYKDVPDSKLIIALGNKYPVYLEQDATFNTEYSHTRERETLLAQQRGAQAEGAQLDQPSTFQLGVDAATKPALDLPQQIYKSPVLSLAERLGGVPEGTTETVSGVAKETVEGFSSLVGASTLGIGGIGNALVRPALRAAGALALGGSGAATTQQGINAMNEAVQAGNPDAVLEGAIQSALGAGMAVAGRAAFPAQMPVQSPPPVLPRGLLSDVKPASQATIDVPSEVVSSTATPRNPVVDELIGLGLTESQAKAAASGTWDADILSTYATGRAAQIVATDPRFAPGTPEMKKNAIRDIARALQTRIESALFKQRGGAEPSEGAAPAAAAEPVPPTPPAPPAPQAAPIPREPALLGDVQAQSSAVPVQAPPVPVQAPREPAKPLSSVPEPPARTEPSAPSRLDTLKTEIADLVAEIGRARPNEKNALRRKLGALVIERDKLAAQQPVTDPVTAVKEAVQDTQSSSQRPRYNFSNEFGMLGITPSSFRMLSDTADFLQNASKRFWNRFFSNRQPQRRYPVNLDTKSIYPDLAPYAVNREIATTPNSFPDVRWYNPMTLPARAVGNLIDPRLKNLTDIEQTMHTLGFEDKVMDYNSLLMIESIRGNIDSAFKWEPRTGEILDIQPTKQGQSLMPSDVAESWQIDPNSYKLTPKQRTAIELAHKVQDAILALGRKYGIDPELMAYLDESTGEPVLLFKPRTQSHKAKAYFSRPAQTKIDVLQPSLPGTTGLLPASSKYHEKARAFTTEMLGSPTGEQTGVMRGGITYVPGFERRLYILAKSMGRAIAEQRAVVQLAKHGEKFGSPERRARLEARFRKDVQDGLMTSEAVNNYINKQPTWGEAVINARLLNDYVFPEAVAKEIEKYRPKQILDYIKLIDQGNALAKVSRLGFDFGWLTIQSLPLAVLRPHRYAAVMTRAIGSVMDEQGFQKYLNDSPANLEAARELAQLGHPLGTLPDLQRGLAAGQVLTTTKFAPIRVPAQGFGRGFQLALDFTAIELWKVFRDATPKSEWPAVVETIGNMTMRGRMEEIGVLPQRAFIERLFMNAPAFYRGGLSLLAKSLQGNRAGTVARYGLGAILAAYFAMFYGISKLVGVSDEEIERRMDPGSSDFLMAPIELAKGQRRNLGFAGPVRSYMRLFGEIKDAALNDPSVLFDPKSSRNPIIKWFRGKSSPVKGATWDMQAEEDFLGGEVTWPSIMAAQLPIPVQEAMKSEGSLLVKAADSALSFVGLAAFPENDRAQAFRLRSEAAQRLHNKPYEALSIQEQLAVGRDPEVKDAFANAKGKTDAERIRQIKLAGVSAIERQIRIREALPEALQERLAELGLNVQAYKAEITLGQEGGAQTMMLTPRQAKRFEQLIIEEYAEKLPAVLKKDTWEKAEVAKRQEALNEYMQELRDIAQNKLVKEQGAVLRGPSLAR